MLVMVALIHLLPVSGVVSADRLAVLYGLSFEEVNLEILGFSLAVCRLHS
jgi:hypothetical protein